MSESIWGISTGSYSDYYVKFLFRSKAEAEAYIERRNNLEREAEAGGATIWDDERIEEFTLGPTDGPFLVWRATAWDHLGWEVEVTAEIEPEPAPARPEVRSEDEYISARSSDRDAAIKSVADRAAARKAFPPTPSEDSP